jgi:hypothetical protein
MIAAMTGQSLQPEEESHKRSTITGQSVEPYTRAKTSTGQTEDRTGQYGLDSKVRRAKGEQPENSCQDRTARTG